MGESFEAKLIAASEKAVFKKAKQIVRGGEILCCHETAPGVLRAVCRDSHGFIYRSELRGFPNGPFSGTCNCKSEYRGFCPHSMAAALYHAKYTIKYKEEEQQQDAPALWYEGMQNKEFSQLLRDMTEKPAAHLEVEVMHEFPHGASKWEHQQFRVAVNRDGKISYLTQKNMKNLYFKGLCTNNHNLAHFGLQDRQIIRYFAYYGDQQENDLELNSDECAEFLHCLVENRFFHCNGQKIVVHRQPAELLMLVDRQDGHYTFRPAILSESVPLPLNDIKIIVGRNGCWVGMLGEYWWIDAVMDVGWIRNFLHSTPYPCANATEATEIIRQRSQLPIQILPYEGVKIAENAFRTNYIGQLNEKGELVLEVLFDYQGTLCRADNARFVANAGKFIRRDNHGEFEIIRELRNFGFDKMDAEDQNPGKFKLVLREREVIGMFIDEVIPRWFREKRKCVLSSELAAMAGNASNTQISCKVVESGSDSFTLAMSFGAGGIPVRWRDLEAAALKNEFFMAVAGLPGLLIKIPAELRKIASSLQPMTTILPDRPEYPNCDILRIPRFAALYWAKIGGNVAGLVPYEFLRLNAELEDARNADETGAVADRGMFKGELRPYQETGVCWLRNLSAKRYNLILADEMGLGKTVQTIAMLARTPAEMLPACVIAPTSLIDNWKREFAKFAPTMRVVAIAGPDREQLWKDVKSADVCICSYVLAKRDAEQLLQHKFKYLFLDEAQHIKNPDSQNAHICKCIAAEHKIVLTGTPLENSIEDLWSIFDFLHPGILGSLRAFRARYANIDSGNELRLELARFISPFILRRKKSAVCTDLPPKQEQDLFCNMDGDQGQLYRKYEEIARKQCEELKSGTVSPQNRMNFLTSLLRLRQICCCPELLPSQGETKAMESAKFELMKELVLECLDSDHKILIFSQFVGMLKIIREWLEKQGISYEYLDGSTTDRMAHIDAFNNKPEIQVFLLSLKAGGLGLNLTAADTVILYDPWWNPAVEEQAIDRTHRIGQTKSVTCCKLFVRGTIEERVRMLQEKKQKLFSALVDENTSAMSAMSIEDFEFLLDIPQA